MPDPETNTLVEEPARELRPDEPREFGTPISEIFKQLMPYEDELEQTSTEPKKEEVAPAKPAEPPKKEEKKPESTADIPGLPKELFGEGKKKEEPAPTEQEVQQVETPKDFKGKTKEHFEALSTKEFQTAKRNKELERELTEIKSKPADPDANARIQQLEGELKQYRERIYAADVTLDPKFEAQFKIPREQHLERAKSAYQEAGGDPKDIEAALAATGKGRADKLDEIYGAITNKYLLGKIEKAVDSVENIDSQISGVMQNREAWLKQSQEEQRINRHKYFEKQESTIRSNLDSAEKWLADQGWEVYKTTDDPNAKWWNDQKAKVRQAAEHIMLKVNDPKEMAIASAMVPAAPIYRAMFLTQKERADKAEALLKEYKQSDAGLGGDTPITSTAIEDDPNMSMTDAVLKRLRRGK